MRALVLSQLCAWVGRCLVLLVRMMRPPRDHAIPTNKQERRCKLMRVSPTQSRAYILLTPAKTRLFK